MRHTPHTGAKWKERLKRIATESYSPPLQQAVAVLLYRWALAHRSHDWGVGFQQALWDLEAEGILVEGAWWVQQYTQGPCTPQHCTVQ